MALPNESVNWALLFTYGTCSGSISGKLAHRSLRHHVRLRCRGPPSPMSASGVPAPDRGTRTADRHMERSWSRRVHRDRPGRIGVRRGRCRSQGISPPPLPTGLAQRDAEQQSHGLAPQPGHPNTAQPSPGPVTSGCVRQLASVPKAAEVFVAHHPHMTSVQVRATPLPYPSSAF